MDPIVDVHVHVFRGADDPLRNDYEIWEYGPKNDVDFCDDRGTVEDVSAAMVRAGATQFVVVNMFVPDVELMLLQREHPDVTHNDLVSLLPTRLQEFNRWALELAEHRPEMTVFVAMDPNVLGYHDGADHLRWAAERGALGVKVHPVMQRFTPDDPRMTAIYATCEELDLTLLSHSGSSKGIQEFAEPAAFASVLNEHPQLKLVLAHLGGGRWQQAVDLAASFPNVYFDLCEIIGWSGAPGAPSVRDLVWMIKQIGSHRVLFGTDYPWYDIERTVNLVLDLPGLSAAEQRDILGGNAIRLIGLPSS